MMFALLIVISIFGSKHCVVHPDGVSQVSKYQDELGNFEFGYTAADKDGEHFHKANKDSLGRVVGSYGLVQEDGRKRIVDYVADHNGFRAHIRSNEPGLAGSASGDVTVQKIGANPISTNIDHSLDFAASSDTETSFGDRLRETNSRVSYVRPREEEHHQKSRPRPIKTDAENRGRRRQNPNPSRNTEVTASAHHPQNTLTVPERVNLHNTNPVSNTQYQPPINPFRTRQFTTPLYNSHRYPTFQQIQPSTPPYGGLETRNPLLDPLLQRRYPITPYPFQGVGARNTSVTMSSIHGGIGDSPYLLNPTLPTRPLVNDPRHFSSAGDTRPIVHSGHGPVDKPNLILRAIAINNGIQAVHVDPATGEMFHSPASNLHVDEHGDTNDRSYLPDDRNIGYRDSPYENRRNIFSPSHQENVQSRNQSYIHPSELSNNRQNFIYDPSLNSPSSKDLNTINRILDEVNRRNVRHPIEYKNFGPAPGGNRPFQGYNHNQRQGSSGYPGNANSNIGSYSDDANDHYRRTVLPSRNEDSDYENYSLGQSNRSPGLGSFFPINFEQGFPDFTLPQIEDSNFRRESSQPQSEYLTSDAKQVT